MPEKISSIPDRFFDLIVERPKEAVRIANHIEKIDIGRSGQIAKFIGMRDNTLVRVGTDAAAFVEPDRDTVTEDMVSCVGVFLKGPRGHCIAHLTPSSRLGYSSPGAMVGNHHQVTYDHLTSTLDQLMPGIEELGDLEHVQGVILANVFEEDRPELEKIKQSLEQRGLKHLKIEILPFDHSLIAYLPGDAPDSLVVMGRQVSYPDGSQYLQAQRENVAALIPIDPESGQTLALPEKPKIRQNIEKIREDTHGLFDAFS